jgi:two-component system, sensor histidine kinase and response regulator
MTGKKLSYIPVILIVDDNPENLEVLGKKLKDNEFEVEFAISGEIALSWLKIRKFDLILLDINMPDISGFDVCRQIRSEADMDNTPIIFLSADSDRESILRGFELGAQDYITKPFDSRELIVRVETQLRLRESLEKLEKLNKTLEEKVLDRTRQLNEAIDRLEATNMKLIDLDRAKSDFLNLISHEIRTPLNGIIGPIELLKSSANTSEIAELIQILDLSVKRLERFALNALLLTQLRIRKREIKMEKISLHDIIEETLIEENDKVLSKNISISLINVPGDKIILAEPSLMKKCIGNIIDNAIHYSPLKGCISISVAFEGNFLICEFQDQGTGFSPEVLDNVFELFRSRGNYRENSAGIGLPIAKMIMESHGGDIILTNHSSGGASVKLLLPVRKLYIAEKQMVVNHI